MPNPWKVVLKKKVCFEILKKKQPGLGILERQILEKDNITFLTKQLINNIKIHQDS